MAFVLGRGMAEREVVTEERIVRDTIIVRDVVFDTVYRDKVVYRRLPAVEVVKRDTIVKTDTVVVAIPIDTYIAQDSNYYVEATGYDVKFRNVTVYPQTRYVTEKVAQPSRWGIGVQVGCGASRHGLTPYVGVGVQYNIINL